MKIRMTSVFAALACTLLSTVWIVRSESTNLPCGVSIDFQSTNTVPMGSNLVWTLTLVNQSSSNRTCHAALDCDAIGYNGAFVCDILQNIATNLLTPGSTNTLELTITPTNYTTSSQTTLTYEVTVSVEELTTSNLWAFTAPTELLPPTNYFTLSPSNQVAVGNCVTATVSYVHPLSLDLQGVEVHFTAGEEMSTNSTIVEHQILLGTCTNGQTISASTNFTARTEGVSTIRAAIVASNFLGTTSCRDITVVP